MYRPTEYSLAGKLASSSKSSTHIQNACKPGYRPLWFWVVWNVSSTVVDCLLVIVAACLEILQTVAIFVTAMQLEAKRQQLYHLPSKTPRFISTHPKLIKH